MRRDALGLFWQDEPPKAKVKMEKPKRTPPSPTWLASDYLPGLQEAISHNYQFMNNVELHTAWVQKHELIFDIETYPNYFLVGITDFRTGKQLAFEMTYNKPLDVQRLGWILHNFEIIGFNSLNYDLPITTLALAGKDNLALKIASDQIIVEGMRPSDILKANKVKKLHVNHVDLIEVAPLFASLKIYGGRMHTPSMQDLPFHPNTILSPEQIAIVKYYCLKKDLTSTALLRQTLDEQCALRVQLSNETGVDLRSKSDAQIAEAIIGDEISRLRGGQRIQRPQIPMGTAYRYQIPWFIKFQTPLMNNVLNVIYNTLFVVDHTGSIGMPPELKELKIQIANSVYRMGIGGLHSSEKNAAHFSDDNTILIDRDVTSYYPFIILNQGLFPQHLGQDFLTVYRNIVNRRINAKKRGDNKVADSLKITINGSFGKLGSMYSILYSPDLLVQVTITGQLSLLMLIERLELQNINVVSANTDGIVIKCPKHLEHIMESVVKQWEQDTGFETEASYYKGLLSRDVNNYIAVALPTKKKPKLHIKSKGAFAKSSLSKNPTNDICIEAIEKLLTEGVPIERSIYDCRDITKFINVRNVTGGAVKIWGNLLPEHKDKADLLRQSGFEPVEGGFWKHNTWKEDEVASLETAYEHAALMWPTAKQDYLGKSIRWYYAKNEGGELVYAKNGNKVPKSDGAKPLMDIPAFFPLDVDYDYYINETYKMLKQIGYM